jgi:hypothetical protein
LGEGGLKRFSQLFLKRTEEDTKTESENIEKERVRDSECSKFDDFNISHTHHTKLTGLPDLTSLEEY